MASLGLEWFSAVTGLAAAVLAARVLFVVVKSPKQTAEGQPFTGILAGGDTFGIHFEGVEMLATLREQSGPAKWAAALAILSAAATVLRLIVGA